MVANSSCLEILKPRAGIEFGINRINIVGICIALGSRTSLHGDHADNGLNIGDIGGVGCLPSNDDTVARVPNVQLLEVDWWLLALSELELSAIAEGWAEQRERDGGRALRAGVDEGVHGLRVVHKVGRECSVCNAFPTLHKLDKVGIIRRYLLRIGIAEAVAVPALIELLSTVRRCDGANGEEREDGKTSDRNHVWLFG